MIKREKRALYSGHTTSWFGISSLRARLSFMQLPRIEMGDIQKTIYCIPLVRTIKYFIPQTLVLVPFEYIWGKVGAIYWPWSGPVTYSTIHPFSWQLCNLSARPVPSQACYGDRVSEYLGILPNNFSFNDPTRLRLRPSQLVPDQKQWALASIRLRGGAIKPEGISISTPSFWPFQCGVLNQAGPDRSPPPEPSSLLLTRLKPLARHPQSRTPSWPVLSKAAHNATGAGSRTLANQYESL